MFESLLISIIMFKIFLLLFLIGVTFVDGEKVVKQVLLVNHREYLVDVLQEVMNKVEERGWWTLKLPDIKLDIDETVFTRKYTGTVTYKNGFLVSIQHLDAFPTSRQDWNVTEGQVRVYIQAQLTMTDVTLGYDIEADLEDGKRHYTAEITHPTLSFDFWVTRAPVTHQMWITILGGLTKQGNLTRILPRDPTSDALTTMFVPMNTAAGIESWRELFKSIAEDVVKNRVPFPKMCFNCRV